MQAAPRRELSALPYRISLARFPTVPPANKPRKNRSKHRLPHGRGSVTLSKHPNRERKRPVVARGLALARNGDGYRIGTAVRHGDLQRHVVPRLDAARYLHVDLILARVPWRDA